MADAIGGLGAFDELETWLATQMLALSPARRVMLARRVGMAMRQANAMRVAANVTPDGRAMPARKEKKGRPSKKARKQRPSGGRKGLMFRRIEMMRNMQISASPEQAVLSFQPRVAETARVHHYGLTAPVDPRIRNSISTQYPERPLLGFSESDKAFVMASVMEWMASKI